MAIESKEWRLNNLYRIIDRNGNSIRFRLNPVQKDVLEDIHNRNIILKARQLGMSTFAVLYLLDETLYNKNLSAGIVSYSLEHAQHIFKKIIGHALDTQLKEVKQGIQIVQRSAREISFSNGSSLRVDTTLRGGSYPLVLISEFGKTCARNPMKAEEVITGTLQAVPRDGKVIIESTGEGNEGFFAEMVTSAARRGNENLSSLEYKLFFYNWLQEKSYVLQDPVDYDVSLTDYFNGLEKELDTKITQHQRNWYALQSKILGDKIRQEFPSTVTEAFLASSDAFYFADAIEKAYKDNRCLHTSLYDALLPVYVAMDIGVNDLTIMAFFQIAHGEIRVIDYYEDKNKDVDFYAKFLLQDKKYLYHTIFLPHDSVKRSIHDISNTYERDFRRLFSSTGTKFTVLPRIDKQLSISYAKIKFERCVFNISKVKKFLDQLAKYRKKWNENVGRYEDKPLHNEACFVGETLISTEKGFVRIDSIEEGDYVITPSGKRKVLKKLKYYTNKLLRVQGSTKSIICTPHHKIFTAKGLVTADSLKYNDHILQVEDTRIWKTISSLGEKKGLGFKDYFLSMSQEQLFDLTDTNIGKISLAIGSEEVQGQKKDKELFIEQFGYTIMVKFQKVMISIISMVTNQIMKLRILNLFLIPTTCEGICPQKKEKRCHEKVWEKPLKLQKNGMEALKEKNGIANMQRNALRKSRLCKEIVFSVKNITKLYRIGVNIALQLVNQRIEEDQEKIMKQENAKSASKNTSAINTQAKDRALSLVELCLDIEKEVYDLTVEHDNCYFANGFLVSNSNYADCHQYLCQAVGHIETVGNQSGMLEKHKLIVDSRRHRVI